MAVVAYMHAHTHLPLPTHPHTQKNDRRTGVKVRGSRRTTSSAMTVSRRADARSASRACCGVECVCVCEAGCAGEANEMKGGGMIRSVCPQAHKVIL